MAHTVESQTGIRRIHGDRVALASLALIISGVVFATFAFAGEPHRQPGGSAEPLSVLVRYGDLDLSRDEGARALYARLRAAAHRVCAPLDSYDLHTQQLQRECYKTTLADAVKRLNSERVAALHDGGDRRPVPVTPQQLSQSR